MGIQTTNITTAAGDDLVLDPAVGQATKIQSVDKTRVDGEPAADTPISVSSTGSVQKANLASLPQLGAADLTNTDFLALQRADGDYFKIKGDELGSGQAIDPGDNAVLGISPAPLSGTGSAADPYVLRTQVVDSPGGSA